MTCLVAAARLWSSSVSTQIQMILAFPASVSGCSLKSDTVCLTADYLTFSRVLWLSIYYVLSTCIYNTGQEQAFFLFLTWCPSIPFSFRLLSAFRCFGSFAFNPFLIPELLPIKVTRQHSAFMQRYWELQLSYKARLSPLCPLPNLERSTRPPLSATRPRPLPRASSLGSGEAYSASEGSKASLALLAFLHWTCAVGQPSRHVLARLSFRLGTESAALSSFQGLA